MHQSTQKHEPLIRAMVSISRNYTEEETRYSIDEEKMSSVSGDLWKKFSFSFGSIGRL